MHHFAEAPAFTERKTLVLKYHHNTSISIALCRYMQSRSAQYVYISSRVQTVFEPMHLFGLIPHFITVQCFLCKTVIVFFFLYFACSMPLQSANKILWPTGARWVNGWQTQSFRATVVGSFFLSPSYLMFYPHLILNTRWTSWMTQFELNCFHFWPWILYFSPCLICSDLLFIILVWTPNSLFLYFGPSCIP